MSQQQYHVISRNPDKRHKALLQFTCKTATEAQHRIEQLNLGDEPFVFYGERVPVRVKTLVIVGDEPRRRGRPFGSKDKRKRKSSRGAAKHAKGTVGALLKGKKRKVKTKSATKHEPARSPRAKETQADRNARVEAGT